MYLLMHIGYIIVYLCGTLYRSKNELYTNPNESKTPQKNIYNVIPLC